MARMEQLTSRQQTGFLQKLMGNPSLTGATITEVKEMQTDLEFSKAWAIDLEAKLNGEISKVFGCDLRVEVGPDPENPEATERFLCVVRDDFDACWFYNCLDYGKILDPDLNRV